MNNKTIEFFKEISKIPRESGNEIKISDYIVKFAKFITGIRCRFIGN